LLGIWDGDEENNLISYKSPFAQKIIGKSVGDTIDLTMGNAKKPVAYEISKIGVTKQRGKE